MEHLKKSFKMKQKSNENRDIGDTRTRMNDEFFHGIHVLQIKSILTLVIIRKA